MTTAKKTTSDTLALTNELKVTNTPASSMASGTGPHQGAICKCSMERLL